MTLAGLNGQRYTSITTVHVERGILTGGELRERRSSCTGRYQKRCTKPFDYTWRLRTGNILVCHRWPSSTVVSRSFSIDNGEVALHSRVPLRRFRCRARSPWIHMRPLRKSRLDAPWHSAVLRRVSIGYAPLSAMGTGGAPFLIAGFRQARGQSRTSQWLPTGTGCGGVCLPRVLHT